MRYLRTVRNIAKCKPLLWLEKKRQSAPNWRVTQSLYWCEILSDSLGHQAYYLTGWHNQDIIAVLPLVLVRGICAKFLISVPYVNWGGVYTGESRFTPWMLTAAVQLAEKLDADYVEVRDSAVTEDSYFRKRVGHKVLMVRELPNSEESLWRQLACKVRNQVRKSIRSQLNMTIGGRECIRDFYKVYAENMRHLGTPVYPLGFVEGMWQYFSERMEVVVVRKKERILAGGVLLHGNGVTEIPLAASLPEERDSCANMLLYWAMLVRCIQRGSRVCDLGRCTPESGSYRFKKQWGARAEPLVWYYFPRRSNPGTWTKEHPRFQNWRQWWKRLPLSLTTWLGPHLVRGLPA